MSVTPTAAELLVSYLDTFTNPAGAAALFADDGVLEIPVMDSRSEGPAAIEAVLAGLLERIPDFRFASHRIWIDTPDKAFGEYSVDVLVPFTGKRYQQTYSGLLIARDGKIVRLREALDMAAVARAFTPD